MASFVRVARLDVDGARLPAAELVGLDRLHQDLQAVIRRHLPAVAASVLTMPILSADGKTLECYSDLSGQPVQLATLPAARRAQLQARLETRLDSLRRLAKALPNRMRGAESLAAALRGATQYPDDTSIYAIGEEPVLVLWGFVWTQASDRTRTLSSTLRPATGDRRRRGHWWWRLAVALLLGLGLATGVWLWLDRQERDSLEHELQAALAAQCMGPDRLAALAVRLDRLDPSGRDHAEHRATLVAEQARCAAADTLSGALTQSGWDCTRLAELQANPLVALAAPPATAPDLRRDPFAGILASLDERVAICTRAAGLLTELDQHLSDCAALAALDGRLGVPAAGAEPLVKARDRLDRELKGCAEARRITSLLEAALAADAGIDCESVRKLDRESAALDETRPPLAPIRARLETALAQCAQAQTWRQALVDAQLDCVRLRTLDHDLDNVDTGQEPLRSIRRQLDEALGRCETLERLGQPPAR